MTAATCPSCEEVIRHSDCLKVGQYVQCRNCYENLIVIKLNPVVLDWSDGGDWGTDLVSSEAGTSRPKSKASARSGSSRWFGESDDDDWPARSRKPRKKKRGQRRRNNDESYFDF